VEDTPRKAEVEDDEADVLDAMITSLAEVLDEKGVVTQEVREQGVNKNRRS
jgi:hypothetical protein